VKTILRHSQPPAASHQPSATSRSACVCQPAASCWPASPPASRLAGRLASCRPAAGQLPASCRPLAGWPAAGQLPASCRPTAGRGPASCCQPVGQLPPAGRQPPAASHQPPAARAICQVLSLRVCRFKSFNPMFSAHVQVHSRQSTLPGALAAHV
jgi:hypothetical protein